MHVVENQQFYQTIIIRMYHRTFIFSHRLHKEIIYRYKTEQGQ